jgi:small subunit ribosomal protein S2
VKYDKIPVEEARQSKVKVIGLVDTNADPANVDYMIPSNDDAVKVIAYMATTIAEAIKEGRGKFASVAQTVAAAEAKDTK